MTDTQQQPASVPESVRRLMEYAGKQRREVSNPCITANEAIVIANHFSAYGREQGQWVPVSERLPALGVPVLVVSSIYPDQIYAALREDGGEGWVWSVLSGFHPSLNDTDCYECDDDYEYSHWMPLPEPPTC